MSSVPPNAFININVTDPRTLIGDANMGKMKGHRGGKMGKEGPGLEGAGPQEDVQGEAVDRLKDAISAQAAAQKAQIDYLWANKQAEQGQAGQPGAQTLQEMGMPSLPGSQQLPGQAQDPQAMDASGQSNPFISAAPPPTFLPGQFPPPIQIPSAVPGQQ